MSLFLFLNLFQSLVRGGVLLRGLAVMAPTIADRNAFRNASVLGHSHTQGEVSTWDVADTDEKKGQGSD